MVTQNIFAHAGSKIGLLEKKTLFFTLAISSDALARSNNRDCCASISELPSNIRPLIVSRKLENR